MIAGLFGVHQIEQKEEKLQLRQIELRDTRIELRELNQEYRELEQSNDTNEKKLKELRERKKELEKQVKAKKRRERIARENATRTAQAHATQQRANTTTNTHSGSCEAVRGYSWNDDVAYAVCMAESGGNPDATNMNDHHGQCRGSFGLMQLACFHTSNPLNPQENIRVAHQIWQEQGWQPWGAYTSGAYLKYVR